jgi:hypothetical protein
LPKSGLIKIQVLFKKLIRITAVQRHAYEPKSLEVLGLGFELQALEVIMSTDNVKKTQRSQSFY